LFAEVVDYSVNIIVLINHQIRRKRWSQRDFYYNYGVVAKAFVFVGSPMGLFDVIVGRDVAGGAVGVGGEGLDLIPHRTLNRLPVIKAQHLIIVHTALPALVQVIAAYLNA